MPVLTLPWVAASCGVPREAILAVLPSSKYPRRPDGSTGPGVPGFNPLFFGHFAHLTRDNFTAELARVMSDDGRIYEALAHDLWGQAHVLARRKYRYLRWKIARMRKKFDVYSGGRSDDWDRRIH
jgi:hypothetical protein